jgi:SNF2 family DNA or RNA helicase
MIRQKSELRTYQNRVITYLYEHDEAFAVLRMGAGKTISALTAIGELLGDDVIRHGLILAPKRVSRLVWPKEIADWAHTAGLTYAVLDGSPAKRQQLLATAHQRHLTICGIDVAQWLVTELAKLPAGHPLFDLLVVDETSRLKDPKSKRGKALSAIASRFRMRWGLTGTVRPNSALDLFGQAKLITAGRLWGKSFWTWRRDHFYPIDFNGYEWRPLPGHEAIINEDIASISITLAENDMPELPELSILVDEVVLPPAARQAYREMERKLFTEVEGQPILAVSAAVASGKLAQAANGFFYGADGNQDVSQLHDEKAQWITDLVEAVDGEPLIVVYEFREDLALLRRLFGAELPYLGAGVSDRQAQDWVEQWNRGELPLFALHPASGGHGLNLQSGGSRMAWLAPCWSAEYWDQTLARLHRPGQARQVMVHVCVALDSVDELKRMRVISKLSSQQAFERWLASRVAVQPPAVVLAGGAVRAASAAA